MTPTPSGSEHPTSRGSASAGPLVRSEHRLRDEIEELRAELETCRAVGRGLVRIGEQQEAVIAALLGELVLAYRSGGLYEDEAQRVAEERVAAARADFIAARRGTPSA